MTVRRGAGGSPLAWLLGTERQTEGTPGHCSPRSQQGGRLLGVCGTCSVSVAANLSRCGALVGCGHRSAFPVAAPGQPQPFSQGEGVCGWHLGWQGQVGRGLGRGPAPLSAWHPQPCQLPALGPTEACPSSCVSSYSRCCTHAARSPSRPSGTQSGHRAARGPQGSREVRAHPPQGSWQRRTRAGPPRGQGLRSLRDMGLRWGWLVVLCVEGCPAGWVGSVLPDGGQGLQQGC